MANNKSKISDNNITKSDEQPKKYRYQTVAARKKLFIKAFAKNNAMIQTTCDEIGITRTTYYEWLKKDPKFKEECDNAVERKLDRLEGKLNALIEKGDVTTTIFATKCLLKNRGYKEKQEVEVNANLNVNILNVDPIE